MLQESPGTLGEQPPAVAAAKIPSSAKIEKRNAAEATEEPHDTEEGAQEPDAQRKRRLVVWSDDE